MKTLSITPAHQAIGYTVTAPACGDCTYCSDDHICTQYYVAVEDGGYCPAWMPSPIWLHLNPQTAKCMGMHLGSAPQKGD